LKKSISDFSVVQRLERLYREIDGCKRCPLGGLEINRPPRLRCKYGRVSVLIVSQNPSSRRTGESHVWGGLDVLFSYDGELRKVLTPIYITNVVKCTGEVSTLEVQACSTWLRKEIEIIQPTQIVGLGLWAYRWLEENGYSMLKLPHPSYVVRFKKDEIKSYVKMLKVFLTSSHC
jgi:uracil-DNA glycosylase family 4